MLTASISKLVPFTHNPTNVLAVHTSVLNALDYGTHIVLIVDLFVSHGADHGGTGEDRAGVAHFQLPHLRDQEASASARDLRFWQDCFSSAPAPTPCT